MDKQLATAIDELSQIIGKEESYLLEDEVLICECYCVSVGDIRQTCGHLGEVDVGLLEQTFAFGQGCGSCTKNLTSWTKSIFGQGKE